MSQAITDGTTAAVPAPPPAPLIDWTDPASIAMYLAAVLAVVGYIWHRDFTNLAGPIATLAVAAIAAVKSIEQAIKQKAYQAALQQYNQLRIEHYVSVVQPPVQQVAIQQAFNDVGKHIAEVEAKVALLQGAQKPPQKATAPRKTAKRTTRPRQKLPTY